MYLSTWLTVLDPNPATMLIPNDEVNILNTFSVMIIFILLLLLTNLHFKLLSTQGLGADKLLSTQSVKLSKYCDIDARLVLRVTSEYQSFHYMILRDYIHSSVSS